jgi:dTDP-4-amino-4,6-dideoxygalactose transaminase
MKIPIVDLHKQYLSIKNDIDSAISRVISNTSFIGGEEVKAFEKEYASYFGVNHCISCANGTDSLEILLKAIGIKKGDEVIVPAMSWISTSESVSNVGAIPVFVDINIDSCTIDTALIENAITDKTKAIIPVHLYGHPCDMTEIMRIAKKFNLKVIEDCAQSHLAEWDNQLIGTIGDAASFSFYPGKNLGAYGDAGAMITNDDHIARIARQIANHGQEGKHNHLIEGRNSRLDGIQAAILRAKLPYLKSWTNKRIEISKIYQSKLDTLRNIETPKVNPLAKHVFHLFVIKASDRNDLMKYLAEHSIDTAIHYPVSLPFLECYKQSNYTQDQFPNSYKLQNAILSLPMYPELELNEIDTISSLIIDFYKKI